MQTITPGALKALNAYVDIVNAPMDSDQQRAAFTRCIAASRSLNVKERRTVELMGDALLACPGPHARPPRSITSTITNFIDAHVALVSSPEYSTTEREARKSRKVAHQALTADELRHLRSIGVSLQIAAEKPEKDYR